MIKNAEKRDKSSNDICFEKVCFKRLTYFILFVIICTLLTNSLMAKEG